MEFKKRSYISLYLTLVLALILTCIPFDSVYAVKGEVDPPSYTDSFSSSDTFADDYCKATVKGKKMTIHFRTMIPSYEFRIALYGVYPSTKLNDLGITVPAETLGTSSIGRTIYGFEYTIDFAETEVPDGEYFLYISRIQNPGESYETSPGNGALYKNLPFKLTKSVPKIFEYKDVIEENQRVQAIGADYDPDWYLDEYLDDIRFTLKIPATDTYEEMSSYKIDFMRQMSNQITAGATSKYDKLLKLYEYVTSEFYYDSVAFSTHSYQYANPYNNLYNHVNKIASANSDNQGRVATTCQGFSAMFLSMARAQGIPTRFAFGHRATSPSNNWGTENNIKVKDHWWVESYVDGRWIFIDPTIGTNNKWNKNTNVWKYYGLTNYTYFDPSEEQIAVSHIYHNIYPDKRFGYLITDEEEINKLSAFLEADSDGVKNGTIMNPEYVKGDKTTWGDGYKSHFMGNGYGNTTQLQWSNKGFTGSVDFSGFHKLRKLSMHHNKLESVDLSNCTSLESVYLYNNNLTQVDLTNCKNLNYASITTDNKLKEAWLYANKKNIYISSGDNGAFQLKYDNAREKKVQVLFKPDIGYMVKGFYNGSGSKLSSSNSSYSMNPGYNNYEISFKLNPDSYRYNLYNGSNTASVMPYNEAAQKRLKALDYYAGTVNGRFDEELEQSVELFQRANGVTVSGKIDRSTWKALFSSNAVKKPSDEVIGQITEINDLKLYADVTAEKGKVILTWSNTAPDLDISSSSAVDVDGYEIWKSTDKDSGFKKIGSTKRTKYTNRSNLKKGTRYFYKIRAYKSIHGKVYYSQWTQVDIKAK